MLFRARTVLPVSRPAIDDGGVCIERNRIAAVGKWKEIKQHPGALIFDLGDAILLPGLVNAHCHLDYTEMVGHISRPRSFPDWIKALLALKAQWTYSDYAQSWLQGAHSLVRHGVTSVADIEAVPELLPDVWSATPLRVFSFLEMTGVRSRRPAGAILQEAVQTIESLPIGRGSPGLSPHAPYSTSPELLRLTATRARQRNWRVSIHVSESAEEFAMFAARRGPLFDWLKNQRPMSDCGGASPVQHLERHGLLASNLLAVHVNYLAPGDAKLLGRRGASVVHCPRSHAYFQHDSFPISELRDARVNLCLGTDSLASVWANRRQKPELDLFAEMRALASNRPDLAPEFVLQMATTHAALALGRSGQIGEIAAGALADLITVPFSGKTEGAAEGVLNHSGDVSGAMIDGQWVIAPR